MDKLIRINQVMDLVGIKKSTVWLWVKQGKLPQPKKLSPRVTVWKESDILEYIQQAI
ncbi:helix-turn-helix transcriptional regulator [Sulfurimonas microaerophilic]|uniref:helix-turn-helix transcriptional regulator n=1 Tax=Sulfurimonas microaerophilic TaxID=3058392 RepID=UPI002714F5BC|nr:AlpA family phage regulatory protein [Sulfurimonas sp. hsl 1-7]